MLHDAFRKGMQDPVHMQAMEKYDQDLLYMSAEDYAKFARDTFAAESAHDGAAAGDAEVG